MRSLAYPATLTPDREAGGFTVIFPDLLEAITQGEDRLDALEQAADCLEEAIAGRVRRGDEIPTASKTKASQTVVFVPPLMAAKAALYLATSSWRSNSAVTKRTFVACWTRATALESLRCKQPWRPLARRSCWRWRTPRRRTQRLWGPSRHTSGPRVTTCVSDCRLGEAAQEGITRSSEEGDQGAERERQNMAKKHPALFISVKVG